MTNFKGVVNRRGTQVRNNKSFDNKQSIITNRAGAQDQEKSREKLQLSPTSDFKLEVSKKKKKMRITIRKAAMDRMTDLHANQMHWNIHR